MGVATPAILLVPLGLFLKPLIAEFGGSRTDFSVILSAAGLANAVSLPFAGYLVDRFGARQTIAVGTVLGCGAYASISLADSYRSFIALTVLAVLLGNLASYPAFMSLAQRWFDRRLGLALALTSTGLAVGVAVFSYVIVGAIGAGGWRTAFPLVGLSALAAGLVSLAVLIRDNPGPVPDAERRDGFVTMQTGGHSLGEALRTYDFWLYSVSFLLVVLAVVGTNVHLPALLSDGGAAAGQAASVVAIGSAGSLFGRLFTGILLDRFSARGVAALFFAGQAIGLLLLLEGLRWALPASFLLGAVQGAEIDLLGFVIARRFGRAAYARVFGTAFSVTLIGAIVGPLIMAKIFDRTGSYDMGLMIFPALPLLAFGLLWLATARAAAPRESD